jgi:hypothetical protein
MNKRVNEDQNFFDFIKAKKYIKLSELDKLDSSLVTGYIYQDLLIIDDVTRNIFPKDKKIIINDITVFPKQGVNLHGVEIIEKDPLSSEYEPKDSIDLLTQESLSGDEDEYKVQSLSDEEEFVIE